MLTRMFGSTVLAIAWITAASSQDLLSTKSKVTPVFDHTLPNAPGKSIKSVLVDYPPGGSSPPHSHAPSAFIYATVLQGAIRSKVNDSPEKVYHVGESFYEMPGDHHAISANASEIEPARLMAVFIVDSNEKNLTTPDKQ